MNKTLLFVVIALSALAQGCGKKEPPKAVAEKKIIGEEVTYSADNVNMKGYLAYDAGKTGKRPGVLVVHEWWGHNDYARNRASMLAEMGYVALAVDMYGDGKTAAHPQDAMKFAGEVAKNMDGAKARFEKALEILKANPNTDGEKIAAIGYCFGGGVVLNMARIGTDLKGVVSFHGSIATSKPAEKGMVKARVLVCNGADDTFVTAEQIDAFKKEMENAGVMYTFNNYPGAIHSFTNPAADSTGKKFDMAIGYNAAADSASWADMTSFFGEIFK